MNGTKQLFSLLFPGRFLCPIVSVARKNDEVVIPVLGAEEASSVVGCLNSKVYQPTASALQQLQVHQRWRGVDAISHTMQESSSWRKSGREVITYRGDEFLPSIVPSNDIYLLTKRKKGCITRVYRTITFCSSAIQRDLDHVHNGGAKNIKGESWKPQPYKPVQCSQRLARCCRVRS